jgi:outer membrane protein TolC
LAAAPVQGSDLDDSVMRMIEGDEPGARAAAPSAAPRARAPAADRNGGAMTLSDAERLALENDPSVKAAREKVAAFEEQSAAAQRLPDPKLKIGVNEYPVDAERRAAENVNVVVGLQQAVMPRALREHMSAQMEAMGRVQDARAARQKLIALREARKAWLKVYLKHHTAVIYRQNQKLLAQIQQITQQQYRAGTGTQSDVLQAQLESSLLKDREIAVEAERETALAELAKWAGPGVFTQALALDSLELPLVAERARIESGLERHPALEVMKLEADAAKEGVEVARARAKPEWMFELETMWMYTKKGDLESDSVSAFVVVDLPFFRKNLQDRWLAASEKDYTAALFLAADEKRDLKRMLDQEFANWKRFDERLSYYKDVVLPQAGQNSQAALRAYQAQVAEFTQLMRARQIELDSKLEALRMLVERAMAQAELLYLAGEGI